MTSSAISAFANVQTASSQPSLGASHHRRGSSAASLTDIDALGSSVASSPSSTGKTASKVDVSA